MDDKVQLTSLNDALVSILANLTPVKGTKEISLLDALGRVLAEDIISTINVPAHNNSAMDGYALRAEDLKQSKTFKLAGSIHAGEIFAGNIEQFACVRIMTGAPVPQELDFVVPQEYVVFDKKNQTVEIKQYTGGSNVRKAGEDLSIGSVALHAGRKLGASDIGLLASLGLSKVSICRKLKVGFFSTGDELIEPGEYLLPGKIYDSNRYSVIAMLKNLRVKPLDLGIVKDEPAAIRKVFLQAADSADVILTTGGVSVGDADYVKQVLNEIGQIDLWRLNIKPGKPLAFGKINQAYFFGLPGNPASAAVVFYKIVKPVLKTLMGQTRNIFSPDFKARVLNDINKTSSRMEFMRGILNFEQDEPAVNVPANQGSGILSSMSKADCLVILNENTKNVKAGDIVDVQPFYGLL